MSEASTSVQRQVNRLKINLYVPRNTTQMHMIYGDAEVDGPTSKCILIDITSSLITFNIVTESRLKVIHIWYKPSPNLREKCSTIIYHVKDSESEEFNPGVNASVYIDTLETIELGANVAFVEPHFSHEDFRFETSAGYLCDVNVVRCHFCSWTGTWFAEDNHYMKFHANKEVLEDPFNNFDNYF